jgi:hypothetical protein
MGKYTGRRTSPHTTRLPTRFQFLRVTWLAGRHHIEDWLRAEQELLWHYASLRSADQYPRRIESRHSNERLICDVHKTNFGAGMFDLRHAGSSTGGEGNAAHVERPVNPSGQKGRSDGHCGISAGQFRPNPSPQCIWVYLCVLEGSIVMQVRGGKEVTLTPGQTFYEGPDDVHVVGRNASQTKPAKFVVFFVKDKGAPVLVPAQ